nr:restriction endonuclease subunit S [Candidatus Delongbacteria bacterium]
EQEKIADFLSDVDSKIEKLSRKKDLMSEYKKGVMQKIFSQEIRFKDTSTSLSAGSDGLDYPDWEEKKLGKLTTLITKGTTPTSVGHNFVEEGINFIKAENISKINTIDISGTPKITEECNNKLSRSILRENDILFSIAGTLGRTVIVKKEHLPANTNQALSIIRLKESVNLGFMYYSLILEDVTKHINKILSVGAQPNLNLQQIGNFKIQFPSVEEQKKIAEFLTNLDKKIENIDTELKAVKEFKKGLLQTMFV